MILLHRSLEAHGSLVRVQYIYYCISAINQCLVQLNCGTIAKEVNYSDFSQEEMEILITMLLHAALAIR